MSQEIDAGRGSKRLLWAWRGGAMAFAVVTLTALLWQNALLGLSPLVFSCLSFFLISLSVLIAFYGETKHNDEGLEGQDPVLFTRIKRAHFPHVLGILCAMSLYPVLYSLSKQYLHTTEFESWLIACLPGAALVRALRTWWPVSGVSDTEARRVGLLTVDRHRRRQAMAFVILAVMCLLYILSWLPQLIRANHGQPIHLGMFQGVGVPSLTFLFLLAGPSLLGGRAALQYFPEDETVIHFRNIAYRNGFFVMAAGMIAICDLVRNPPRLSVVLVPMVLELAMAVAFMTIAVLEFRAGTFKGPDEAAPTEDRALLT